MLYNMQKYFRRTYKNENGTCDNMEWYGKKPPEHRILTLNHKLKSSTAFIFEKQNSIFQATECVGQKLHYITDRYATQHQPN